MPSFIRTLIYPFTAGVLWSSCVTTPLDTKAETRTTAPLGSPAATSSEAETTAGTAIIKKPRVEAIEHIKQACHDSYEILEEGMPTTEVGVAVPIGKNVRENHHWFVRYRCKGK